jgi:enoyl-CoA hydratase/carnithine racemase
MHHDDASLKESYDHILVEKRFPSDASPKGGGVGLITLHRPKALNALCDALFDDLIHAVKAFDHDEDIGCVVITGSTKAFAAGEYNTFRNEHEIESRIQAFVKWNLTFLRMKQTSRILKERISQK